jgi:hypothetical protein
MAVVIVLADHFVGHFDHTHFRSQSFVIEVLKDVEKRFLQPRNNCVMDGLEP